MAPDDHAPTYSLNTGTRTDIQPEEWQQQIQEQFLDFCGDEINEKNRQKLEYAEEFLQNPEEEYRVWKEEIDPRQPTQEMLEQESDIDSSTLVDATLHDLIDTMQGLVPSKDDPEAY
ncbi:MAG: hypothetical protein SVU32_06960, partial [Candidatus Nanohaloarchaea archaeon]|nr:hypothetical protein [Candidatus Nanohaloarchaea archaeon]